MTQRHPHVGQPSRWAQLLEARAPFEAATIPYALPLLLSAPRGDGHPVLLMPGFMGSEGSLIALQTYLRNRGYAVRTWGLGRNVGFRPGHASAIEQQIRYLHHETGRTVSLVGWSLGGVFAMYGAHRCPQQVRSVITLGSPVTVDATGTAVPPLLRALYRLIAHPLGSVAHSMQPRVKTLRERTPLPMPVSCLYSLSDGVVPPQEATLDGDPARHENIRVAGSHVGLGFNPLVLRVVADRLAQPEGQWQPYRPTGFAGYLHQTLTHALVPI